MAEETNVNVCIDQFTVFSPLIAGDFLNAYYSALILKRQNGIEITAQIQQETLNEVFPKWKEILLLAQDALKMYQDQQHDR